MSEESEIVAALRVWMETPYLCVSYERRGITICALRLRKEAALAGTRRLVESLPDLNGDPEMVGVIKEFLTMVSEVLAGSDGQVLPLTGGGLSVFDEIFGSPS